MRQRKKQAHDSQPLKIVGWLAPNNILKVSTPTPLGILIRGFDSPQNSVFRRPTAKPSSGRATKILGGTNIFPGN